MGALAELTGGAPAAAPPATGGWRLDPARSRLSFAVRHLRVATVRGTFADVDGALVAGDDGWHAHAGIGVASVATGDATRDARLRLELFEADRFPAMTLSLEGDGMLGPGGHELTGRLTVRDVTRPIPLQMSVEVPDTGTLRVRVEAEVRRSALDLDWPALREAGRLLVSDRVRVSADVVLERGAR